MKKGENIYLSHVHGLNKGLNYQYYNLHLRCFPMDEKRMSHYSPLFEFCFTVCNVQLKIKRTELSKKGKL